MGFPNNIGETQNGCYKSSRKREPKGKIKRNEDWVLREPKNRSGEFQRYRSEIKFEDKILEVKIEC